MDFEVKSGFYDVIKRLVPDKEARLAIDKQIDLFKSAGGMFGHDMAIETRETKQPAQWWDSYGDSAPELQEIAIRILSLTCSATGCERNWSVFQHVHSKKRNRLLQARLSSLVYVKYNLQLETRARKKEKKGDNYDPICLSDMESDDEWITPCDDEPSNKDPTWLDVHEYFKVVDDGVKDVGGAGGSKKRKKGPRDLRKKSLYRGVGGKGKETMIIRDEEEEEEVEDEEEEDEGIARENEPKESDIEAQSEELPSDTDDDDF